MVVGSSSPFIGWLIVELHLFHKAKRPWLLLHLGATVSGLSGQHLCFVEAILSELEGQWFQAIQRLWLVSAPLKMNLCALFVLPYPQSLYTTGGENLS